MMCFNKIVPTTFLCRFPLHQGAFVVGVFVLVISIICVISLGIEILFYKHCTECTTLVMHNVYSFSINALIYCFCMIFVNLWFIWGARKGKSSVVLSWVVITTMWWAQSFALVCVLMSLYIKDSSIGWILALVCAIIAFMIFFYFILVGYAYWLQIRKIARTPIAQDQTE
ncbi:hypothetical protein PYW08_011640 [Mythimna loreyi]|uniref:Uncharacterized protein n=1 Tax=Mythimna loreyi TaxID=667449 RepID=A0ACC2QMK8_9NEOP|nr:hypothetical protein PYW08_011640 [Mythimna loreyi]